MPTKRAEKPREGAKPVGPKRAGTVALVGRPNVGKSTLLNAALGHPLSIISPMPQTTRDAILGVVHYGGAELRILDTPGLHRARSELGRVMNETARDAARSADVVVFVTEVSNRHTSRARAGEEATLAVHPSDLILLADIGRDQPTVLVLNKIDRARDKRALLPLLTALGQVRSFAAVVPISARREDGVTAVLEEVAKLCPEAPWEFGADDMTDRPTRFFAAEYIREQILRATAAEVPHAVAVTIDRFVEPASSAPQTSDGHTGPRKTTAGQTAVHIDATIHVERPGQKRIIIGTAGSVLKAVGTEARLRIEELLGQKVNLKLWVRVDPAWRQSARELNELGYRRPAGSSVGPEVEIPDASVEFADDDGGDETTNDENEGEQ